MAIQDPYPARAQLTPQALTDTAIETRVGILERWRQHRAEHKRRVIVQWLRRTANRSRETDPIRRRRDALLHYRAAAVRADLLEIAATLERTQTPTRPPSRPCTNCSQTGATARSTTPASPCPSSTQLSTTSAPSSNSRPRGGQETPEPLIDLKPGSRARLTGR